MNALRFPNIIEAVLLMKSPDCALLECEVDLADARGGHAQMEYVFSCRFVPGKEEGRQLGKIAKEENLS